MYGLPNLKESVRIDAGVSECPVIGCKQVVPRQKKVFRKSPEFYCADHRIYVSPSTFEYGSRDENLLWYESDDRSRLEEFLKFKRESRLERERSEDAVTWNMIRALEKSRGVRSWVHSVTGCDPGEVDVAYWSHDRNRGVQKDLEIGRSAYGEHRHRSSEPDVILHGENALVFVEAKFTSVNRTSPSEQRKSERERRYSESAGRWAEVVTRSSFLDIAVADRFYELLRLWLLGSWAAKNRERPVSFTLINLVCDGCDVDVEAKLGRHLVTAPDRHFRRATWEGIATHLETVVGGGDVTDRVRKYLREKSAGYDISGRIRRGFMRNATSTFR